MFPAVDRRVTCGLRCGTTVVLLVLPPVAGAFLMALSLGTSGYAWLGWLTLLPLFVAIRVLSPLRAMLSGALWGLSLYVFGVSFFPTGISSGLSSLVLLTAVPAAYTLLASWLTAWIGFSPLVLGVSWMGVELALEPLGLRLGLLGGTQGDSTLMHWAGGALGYVLVAFVVALGNAVLLLLLSRVPVGVASPRCLPGSTSSGTRLIAQTFACFPLYVIPPSQPRGPPSPLRPALPHADGRSPLAAFRFVAHSMGARAGGGGRDDVMD